MENINLIEILKDAPKGIELYCTIYGKVSFISVEEADKYPIRVKLWDHNETRFTKEGRWAANYQGECVLFPSKEDRNWSTFKVEKFFKVGDHVMDKRTGKVYLLTAKNKSVFKIVTILSYTIYDDFSIGENHLNEYKKVEKFDPKLLKSFDRVLVYDDMKGEWFVTHFSHFSNDSTNPYATSDGCSYRRCIPYNTETEYLKGTDLEEPDFYKID